MSEGKSGVGVWIAARATTAQTDAQYHDQIRQTTLQVRQNFTNLVLAKATLKLAQDNLSRFRHELQINHDRYDAGDIGKLDYERLDLQLAQFESDESSAEMNLVQASDQLQTLIGYRPAQPHFRHFRGSRSARRSGNLTDLEQKALAARPDYRAAQAAVRVADANVKLAYANGTADPTLEGEYDRTGSLQLGWLQRNHPDTHFDRNQGNKDTTKYLARPADSARSRRKTRSIPTWTRPGLNTSRPKCFPTATTGTIWPRRRMFYPLRSSLTSTAAWLCSTISVLCRTIARPA